MEPAVVGATTIWNLWNGSVRVRYLGPSPLIEDDSDARMDRRSSTAGINYQLDRLEFRLDPFNTLRGSVIWHW